MLKKSYTLAQLAEIVSGQVKGDKDCRIIGVSPLAHGQPQYISFLANKKFRAALPETQVSAVILAKDNLEACTVNAIVVENPELAYARIASLFVRSLANREGGIHATAIVPSSCSLGKNVSIGARCVLGENVAIGDNTVILPGVIFGDDCKIGKNCLLYSNVTLYHDVVLGDEVILHSGSVLGSDGFGYAQEKGIWHKVPQLGGVRIGNKVEVGSNTSIDRGAIKNTVIEDGVKIDNQVQIAHNVHIGKHTAIAGGTAVAGSVTIGAHCILAGQAGIAGHLEIADGTVILGKTGVAKTITEPGGIYSSSMPGLKVAQWHRVWACFKQLDKLFLRVRRLEKELESVTTKS